MLRQLVDIPLKWYFLRPRLHFRLAYRRIHYWIIINNHTRRNCAYADRQGSKARKVTRDQKEVTYLVRVLHTGEFRKGFRCGSYHFVSFVRRAFRRNKQCTRSMTFKAR